MADAACAVQSCFHRPDAIESEENTCPGLETSISFGRFVSESLEWGRFSSFRQNRYIEEVKKSSKPGSVAQMKAHFEAHFKRVAEMKAAAKAAQENPNLTVSEMEPQNSSTCRDEKEERSKDLNEIQEEVPGESLEERLPEDDEANEQEGSEKKEKVFEGFNEENETVSHGFNAGDENHDVSGISNSIPRRIEHPTKPPLQESSSANREIPPPSSLKGKKQISTFISSKWAVFGKSSAISPSSGDPEKKETSLKPTKAPISRYPRTAVETTPSSSKSTPALKTPTRSCSSKSTPPVPKTPTRSSSRSKFSGTTPHHGSQKVNVTSQSVSTSCWNSSTSVWKKPVQVVCSPFKFRSEERAEKRREFNHKLEDKHNAEKLERDTKAKENAQEELKKLRLNLGFKARPLPGFYKRTKS